jgi:hypothetical protein
MVCASREKSAKIAGGFVLLSVASLLSAWRTCRARPLGIGDFRVWLACHELEGRRCVIHRNRDRSPSYGAVELAKLLGVTRRRARASVRRLEAAGLIEWSDSAVGFVDPRIEMADLDDTIGRGRGSVAIPRRLLRLLAGGARPAVIATALGVLLRCLSRRKGGWDGRGRVKASWIASVFDVDQRGVKQARKELVALGWIRAEPDGQRAMNRWGGAYRIDLAWEPPAIVRAELLPTANPDGPDGRSLPPLPSDDRPEIATPSVNLEPLPERAKNQEPAERGPAGFSIEGQGGEDSASTTQLDRPPIMLIAAQASPELGSRPADRPAPTLDDVRLEDLKDTGRLLDLHRQAVAKGLVTSSEADRLRFVEAAEHALAIGKANPAGLFSWLVRGRCWRHITADAEDRTRRRLKVHDLGTSALPSGLRTVFSMSRPIDSGLSGDARIVREVRATCIRAGVFRDPWPAFFGRNPTWTQERWEAAMVELGLD